jgi:hypothetical protein
MRHPGLAARGLCPAEGTDDLQQVILPRWRWNFIFGFLFMAGLAMNPVQVLRT